LGVTLASALGYALPAALAICSVSSACAALGAAAAARWAIGRDRRARAQHRTTLVELLHALGGAKSEEDVVRAIEASVAPWLGNGYVEVALGDDGHLGNSLPRFESGFQRRARDTDGSHEQELRLPLAFDGVTFGSLHIFSRAAPEEFEGDRELFAVVAKLGAFGVAAVRAQRELAQSRTQQALAWRGEREVLLETVAAEIAHEVRYPINFFKSLFDRAPGDRLLELEDMEIGREEVARLERLVAGLRRVVVHKLERRVVRVSDICARAEALLRDAFPITRLEIEIRHEALLRCDVHQATQILLNLLTNAFEAAGAQGEIGLVFAASEAGAELQVWDTGPGFTEDPARLFAPWYTTKLHGTGLGLAITHRLVRAHGWTITAARDRDRTVFTVGIRSEDLIQPGEGRGELATEAEVA
jgi:signal transduction histidine kinase